MHVSYEHMQSISCVYKHNFLSIFMGLVSEICLQVYASTGSLTLLTVCSLFSCVISMDLDFIRGSNRSTHIKVGFTYTNVSIMAKFLPTQLPCIVVARQAHLGCICSHKVFKFSLLEKFYVKVSCVQEAPFTSK